MIINVQLQSDLKVISKLSPVYRSPPVEDRHRLVIHHSPPSDPSRLTRYRRWYAYSNHYKSLLFRLPWTCFAFRDLSLGLAFVWRWILSHRHPATAARPSNPGRRDLTLTSRPSSGASAPPQGGKFNALHADTLRHLASSGRTNFLLPYFTSVTDPEHEISKM